MPNFMLEDVLTSTQAFLVFSLFLIPPGYVIGHLSNVIGFRSRSLLEKLLLAVLLSICVAPGLAVLVGRFISLSASFWLFLATAVFFGVLFVKDIRRQPEIAKSRPTRSLIIASAFVLTWVVLALGSLISWQTGNRLYLSVTAFDASVRADFVEACLRTGVPPHNPFFIANGAAPVMRYFYYWYVLCALPAKLLHVSGRAALMASSAWCGIALAGTIALLLKHFLGISDQLRRITLFALALIGITGLDVLMVAWYGRITPDLEWWDGDQITSWTDSLLWTPHHVAALIACVGGFLVLWTAIFAKGQNVRIASVIVAAFSFSTASGLSIYVTIAFTLFMALWTLFLLFQRNWSAVAMCLAAGVGALLLAAPYLRDLLGPGSAGTGFVVFHVPVFGPVAEWASAHGMARTELQVFLWRVVMLVLHHVFELGFFFIVLVIQLIRDWRSSESPSKSASWLMLGSSFFVCSFLASAVIEANDLGWRAAMIMQLVLLLWGAVLLNQLFQISEKKPGLGRRLLTVVCLVTIAIGGVGSVFQLYILRTYTWYGDHGLNGRVPRFPLPPHVGERTFEVRSVFHELDRKLPASAVLQHNPLLWDLIPYHLFSKFQFAAGDEACGTAFGGDSVECNKFVATIAQVYGPAATLPQEDLNQLCDHFHVDVLIAEESDPAWKVDDSWVWTRKPLAATPNVRALPCGTRLHQ